MCPHSGHFSVTYNRARGYQVSRREGAACMITDLEQVFVCSVHLGLCLTLLPECRRKSLRVRPGDNLDVLVCCMGAYVR